MNRLIVCICSGLLSSVALAETPVNQWLDGLDSRGVEIELIRVASEKAVVATKETDAEVESILKEAEALDEGDEGTSDKQKNQDST